MAAAQRPWAAAVALVVAASTLLAVASSAQSLSPVAAPGPAGGLDSACMNALLNMSDCLTYVEKGSAARRPDKPCCPELAGLVGSNPVCLCELLSGAADSYGIAVDYARAVALPGICRVSTPPVSTCTALGYKVHLGPAAAPMSGAPSPMSGLSPAGEGPQFPGISPFASPPNSASHAARRFSAGHLSTLAVLPLAAAAISGML
ncbi:non-specific lipid transfer protein GPI-anchored 2-like [Phragmites australis]|uniref:non-specific lipid transfer protein GPI-anchored 2-like n=1 Tax=Phragmites australis TaxID=29695 RepID=UPI002D792005|nr:non-specific lipid transfer protein GPI-anchored 2-like [Phragmites australis]